MKAVVFVPVFNQLRDLPRVLDDLRSRQIENVDVLVVNNGSTDGSEEICCQAEFPLIEVPKNLGVGHSMILAIDWALEHGYDIFCNFTANGKMLAKDLPAVPRHRRLVKAGQMVQGTTENAPPIIDFAGNICDAFGAADVCCVQIMRRADGRLYFVEINPRYGTGVSLSIPAGVDFPQIQWLQHHAPQRMTAQLGKFKAGLEMLRYWEEVYR